MHYKGNSEFRSEKNPTGVTKVNLKTAQNSTGGTRFQTSFRLNGSIMVGILAPMVK